MGDDAAGHHVGTITDVRGVVADGRGGGAEVLQVVQAGNPGAVAADAGIVEDHSGSMEFCREVGGIHSAMRRVDHDRVDDFRADAGDAVSNDDGSGHEMRPRSWRR